MKFIIYLVIFTSVALAERSLIAPVSQKLANGNLSYYGPQFQISSVTKDSLFIILNSNHNYVPGQYDTIGNCPNNNSSCYKHTQVSYSAARMILFGKLYAQTDSGGNFVTDVYCHKKFYYDVVSEFNNRDDLNIEHSWPQSKFSKNFPADLQKTDMHHLYPSDKIANGKRANYPFGSYLTGSHDDLNMPDCQISHLFQEGSQDYFNPPSEHQGNVARSLFYFSVRYKLFLDAKQEKTLRAWHKQDPVDALELARHEQIAQELSVRNPFVDYPELVDKVLDF